jgi:hypothetical protein
MISIFIFPVESAGWEEMGGFGGLTRFRQKGLVFDFVGLKMLAAGFGI